MEDDHHQIGHPEARQMLEGFESVGARRFDVTLTSKAGDKEWFRRNVSAAEVKRNMPRMLDASAARQRNVIVRPIGAGVTFIQLDDLKAEQLPTLAPAVFLTLETSSGNFQAWAALEAMTDKDFARRLRKGAGADPTASGATRVAGSLNFKDKYAPDFPRVAIHGLWTGQRTTEAALEGMGLVAAPEPAAGPFPPSPARQRPGAGRRRWPSYARCLEGAPLNSEETGPDTSRADFVFCMTAISWGWSVQDTADRLMEESAKAQENGKGYADLTARNAALAVERRHLRPSGRSPGG
jgi:RepB DNA-primase from phage plasmid